jgi:hypothetical protein
MIKRIRILGLGPHVDFRAELDPRGENTVTGPSECGKSFLVEAVLFALYGRSTSGRFREEAIHDDAKKALVEITLDSGMGIRRTMTGSRSQTRTILLGAEETAYSTEAAFSDALGPLGRDPEAVETVLAPMGWQELAAGNARKFRDLLARILPSVGQDAIVQSLVEEAGFTVTPEETGLTDKEAGKRRREARKRRDSCEGRLELARERLVALQDATVADIGTIAAPEPELIERVEAWAAYDQALKANEQHAAKLRAVSEWDARRKALGDPTPDPGPDETKELQACQAAVQQAMAALQQVNGQQQMLVMQRQMFPADQGDIDPEQGIVCPTCQRPGWTQGAAMAATLDQQLQGLMPRITQAQTRLTAAQSELVQTQHRHQANQVQRAEKQAWERSLRALGTRPEPPGDVAVPDAPASERPTDAEIEQVQQASARAQALERMQAQQAAELEAAEATVQREKAQHDEAVAEAERWDAVLEAIRKAPSVVAARQARALGDLSPVSLEFGENPAVTVLIDGRPWWLASRGRQVVADAVLRDALRRAMEMPHLPVFVDNVQDVGGQPLPAIPGPVVWLQTTDGKGLFVRRKTVRQDTAST